MSAYREYQDEDSYRLPSDLTRTGYDADTQTYTYTSSENGRTYTGLPGNRYGRLLPTSSAPTTGIEIDHEHVRNGNRQAWRYLLPFFLLVIVFLWMFVAPPWRHDFSHSVKCDSSALPHEIGMGETCWGIAEMFKTTTAHLKAINPKMDCAKLEVGDEICVPKVV